MTCVPTTHTCYWFPKFCFFRARSALTEKIVVVLPKMKCPHLIEPHQIQGLDYIHIFPVMQWLVKRSEQNRAEKAERLKAFAIGQFHNYFALKSDQDSKEKYINGTSCVQHIQVHKTFHSGQLIESE